MNTSISRTKKLKKITGDNYGESKKMPRGSGKSLSHAVHQLKQKINKHMELEVI